MFNLHPNDHEKRDLRLSHNAAAAAAPAVLPSQTVWIFPRPHPPLQSQNLFRQCSASLSVCLTLRLHPSSQVHPSSDVELRSPLPGGWLINAVAVEVYAALHFVQTCLFTKQIAQLRESRERRGVDRVKESNFPKACALHDY
jgi:hypothetical protein